MVWLLLATAIASLLVSMLLTPMVMALMRQAGMVDRPDGRRKLHADAVPLAGGIAIWLAAVAALCCGQWLWRLGFPSEDRTFWLGFLGATGLICLVGLADDAWDLRGRHKILGQMLACIVVISSGLIVESIRLFGADISLGIFAVPFTMFWLLGAINAINLMDGMDGLASTIGGMIGLALCLMAALNGHVEEAFVMAALVGAIAGFLFFNLPPARVFLGDTGSMVIGLVLGVIAVRASLKSPATIALAAPVTIWTLPILDAAMAILRRRLTGRSILIPDRAHLHHRLSERGLTPGKSLLLIVCLAAITTLGAILSMIWSSDWVAPIVALGVIAFLASSRLFGHSELALLARQGRSFLQSLVPSGRWRRSSREHRSRIQGTTEWDQQWEMLLHYADRCDLTSIQLSINLPALHEQFFARWNRGRGLLAGELYHVEIPLASSLLGPIGLLRISGCPGDESSCMWIAEMVEGLRPFELQICDLLAAAATSSKPVRLARSDAPAAASVSTPGLSDSAEPDRIAPIRGSASAPVAADVHL